MILHGYLSKPIGSKMWLMNSSTQQVEESVSESYPTETCASALLCGGIVSVFCVDYPPFFTTVQVHHRICSALS